jgi:hypothetical protein
MPQPAPFNPPLKTYPFFIFYSVEPTDTCLEDEAWQCRRGSILLRRARLEWCLFGSVVKTVIYFNYCFKNI